MRAIPKRLAALILVAALTGLCGRLGLSASAEEPEVMGKTQQVNNAAHSTAFTVMGLAFICAGGIVALIFVKDQR